MSEPSLTEIPNHTNCINCGKCCGIIPVTRQELNEITAYMKTRPEIRIHAQRHSGLITCPFRDNSFRRCMIYPVRPIVCRLMGVTAGMHCAAGNSAEIDGGPYLTAAGHIDPEDTILLNFVNWSCPGFVSKRTKKGAKKYK